MDHAILTRFNLPSVGSESVVRARPGWLRERVQLFERYCLPSVLAQTDRSSRWLIYFDPASPPWFVEWIDEHVAAGRFHPVFRAETDRAQLRSDLRELFAIPGDELVTTNLDNDDALAVDFVARLRAQPQPQAATAYYLVNGLIKTSAGLFRHRDPVNAYPSVREHWAAPDTCWAMPHNRLSERFPVVGVDGPPGWLQVVHGGNVSNRARGRLENPAAHRERFPGLLDDVEAPSTVALAQDRLIREPARAVRDTGVRLAREALTEVVGSAGYDRLKGLVAARRHRGRTRV